MAIAVNAPNEANDATGWAGSAGKIGSDRDVTSLGHRVKETTEL